MSYNAKKVLEDNVTATALVLENTTGNYSPVQVEALKRYRSYGGLKAVLFGDGPLEDWKDASKADRELYMGFRELYQVLDDNLTGREYRQVLESMKNGVLSQFFTPSVIPATLYQVLNNYTEIESIYDPSAGTGVFIDEAFKNLKGLTGARMYEKDLMTGKVLTAIISSITPKFVFSKVHTAGFEESNEFENGYDLICSNIPYGAIQVFDPSCEDPNIYKKIHNYFFWKGLKKIKEGALLGYLVTNAFLDTVTNQRAREYLFMNSDFISLTVMPDNLMKDIANTEAPSHFLVVRKNSNKTKMSEEEELLCVSENIQVQVDGNAKMVTISQNRYIQKWGTEITIGTMRIGKNQYGKPSPEVWWDGPIDEISEPFRKILSEDFDRRYRKANPVLRDPRQETLDRQAKRAKEQQDEPITQYPFDKGAVTVQVAENEQEMPPWELPDEEDPNPVVGICTECGIEVIGGEPFCDTCRKYSISDGDNDYTDSQEVAEQQGDAYDDVEDEETIYNAPDIEDEIIDLGHIAESIANPVQEVKVEYVDNLFNDQTVEFRPGTIMNRKVCTKDLFQDEYQLICVQNIKQTTKAESQEIEYTIPALKPKEQEIIRAYIKIRNAYIALEKAENE